MVEEVKDNGAAGSLAARIEQKVRGNIEVSHLVLQDKSGGCGQSFLLIVISEAFANVRLLDRQR